MTIYYDREIEVKIVKAMWRGVPSLKKEPTLLIEIEHLTLFSDGSGKIGYKQAGLLIQQLQADGGLTEIIKACEPFLTQQLGKDNYMAQVPHRDHENKSLSELCDLYNSMVPKAKRIKKFKDKPTALRRIADIFTAEQPKYGALKDKDPTVGSLPKQIAKTNIPLSGGRSLNVDLTITKGKMSEGGALQTHAELRKILTGRKSSYSGKYIYKAEAWKDKNPRRPGTHGYYDWENNIKEGLTYEEYILGKGQNRHFDHVVKKKFVVLEDKPRTK